MIFLELWFRLKFSVKWLRLRVSFAKSRPKAKIFYGRLYAVKKLDGIKFRRQQPAGYFVVDFYNSICHLVVEVDGPVHNNQIKADRARQGILEMLGLNVLRIKAELVENNLPAVLNSIRSKIEELKIKANQSPSPFMGEGLGEREATVND